MAIHPSVGKVSSVWAIVGRRGVTAYHHAASDLVWVAGVPTVVVQWAVRPDGDLPSVTVPLDPQHLHKLNWPQAEYMYEFAIQDPRALD